MVTVTPDMATTMALHTRTVTTILRGIGTVGMSMAREARRIPAGTLVDTGHSSAAQPRTLTPEPSFSGQMALRLATEGCPKTGGLGRCFEKLPVVPEPGIVGLARRS